MNDDIVIGPEDAALYWVCSCDSLDFQIKFIDGALVVECIACERDQIFPEGIELSHLGGKLV